MPRKQRNKVSFSVLLTPEQYGALVAQALAQTSGNKSALLALLIERNQSAEPKQEQTSKA